LNRGNLHDERGAALIVRVTDFGQPVLIEFLGLNSQSFTLLNRPFYSAYRRMNDRVVFDWTIPSRTQYLIHRDNVLDDFCDFEDFAYHDGDSFFANDKLEAALNSSQ